MKRLVATVALSLLLTGCATEVDPLIQDEIDSAWETYVFHRQGDEIERPDVPIVQVIDYDEQIAKWAECLGDAGYEVDLDADGQGFSIDNGGDANSDDSLLALYICKASYPYDPKSLAGWPTSSP
jgi:hypothetical protein